MTSRHSSRSWFRRPAAVATGCLAAGALLLGPALAAPALAADGDTVRGTYSSLSDGSVQWRSLADVPLVEGGGSGDATVTVDPEKTFQNYRGLGISIDETAVANLFELPEGERREVIKHLVSTSDGAGFDLFRIPIGSPDLIAHLPFWSYDDMPAGEEDFELEHFSIQRDIDMHIIETIKLIQEYNPDAKFFGSAWSAPGWMTTSGTFTGYVDPKEGGGFYQASKLRDDCLDVFARYYVKFIQAYAEQGIDVEAITMLNEPGMDVVYPAMDISIDQQRELALIIKDEFAKAGIDAELWMHDFNFWDWRDPNSTETKNYYRIFEDAEDGSITGEQVREAADGIAFHPYWGDPTVMRDANEETGLPVHMTETSNLSMSTVMQYLNLNVDSYVMWAQITDQDGGTLHWTDKRDNDVDWDEVARTSKWTNRLVTAHLDTGEATYRENVLGAFGQVARYLDTDDVRVEAATDAQDLTTAVFVDDDENYTAVIQNEGEARSVSIEVDGRSFTAEVPADSAATFQWGAKEGPEHPGHGHGRPDNPGHGHGHGRPDNPGHGHGRPENPGHSGEHGKGEPGHEGRPGHQGHGD